MADAAPPATTAQDRIPVGFWFESPAGAQWTNQGMTRLAGFIIEGAAIGKRYVFRVCVPDHIRDEAEEDLATLVAEAGLDYTIHSPRDAGYEDADFADQAKFANAHVPVDAWISIFPNQFNAGRLKAPVSSIFPDAIGLDYHDFSDWTWGEQGPNVIWRESVAEHLEDVNHIITFSRHVARDQVMRHFGFDSNRIRVVPHAPPTLDGILPFITQGARTEESRFRAAELLRRHAAERGWTYLAGFPFEHVRYIAVSTQDRVTKNIRIVADAVDRLVRHRGEDLKAFVTAQIMWGTAWTSLPATIEAAQIQYDVVSMPDLPRDVHAAFYHCAELTVHPSVFEGGGVPFPFSEGISVGTPCLMADGPHVREMIEDWPEMAPYVFDPNAADALADMIVALSADRLAVTARQAEIYARMQQRGWQQVADEYARAALEKSDNGAGK